MVGELLKRLKLKNEEDAIYERGLKRGAIDDGSLYKLGFAQHGMEDNRIFEEKEIIGKPDVAIGLLIDESGSMGGDEPKMRMMSIAIANTLKHIDGVHLCIVGFGYVNRNRVFYCPGHQKPESLPLIDSYGGTPTGHATRWTVEYMDKWFPSCSKKILITLTDGSTNQHTLKQALNEAEKKRIRCVALGLGEYMSEDMLTAYGPGNYAVIRKVEQSYITVANIITKAVREAAVYGK